MSLFKGKYTYKSPERFTKDEARERRLLSALAENERLVARVEKARTEQERRRNERKQTDNAALSLEIQKFLNDAAVRQRQKDGLRPSARQKAFVTLLEQERARNARLTREGYERARTAASDRRQYNPFRDRELHVPAATK